MHDHSIGHSIATSGSVDSTVDGLGNEHQRRSLSRLSRWRWTRFIASPFHVQVTAPPHGDRDPGLFSSDAPPKRRRIILPSASSNDWTQQLVVLGAACIAFVVQRRGR